MADTLCTSHSAELFTRAEAVIPGGVNSPVRAFRAVGGTPPFIKKAAGAYITDVDGNDYVDYVGSWGPMILGHAHPNVITAIKEVAMQGVSFGAPCEYEVELAELICQRIPSVEKVRMVNSGTEAAMSALRLARGYTRRNKIIKFEGHYHGHADSLLVKSGSGALTLGNPSSPGVTPGSVADTLVATYNDLDSVEQLCKAYANDLAAIILEPAAGNMNLLLPEPGFLEGLRELCDYFGCLLIFDEVMTGFRVSAQGYQGLTQVKPDLSVFGKVIGGGLPVGAFGGARQIMDVVAPQGPVYQAGTLSGNPLAMAAGLATLRELERPDVYENLLQHTAALAQGIMDCANRHHIPCQVNYLCGMFGIFFTTEQSVNSYQQVVNCNQQHFKQFFHQMLAAGIYLAPSSYEAGFVSIMHGTTEIDKTLAAVDQAFASLVGH